MTLLSYRIHLAARRARNWRRVRTYADSSPAERAYFEMNGYSRAAEEFAVARTMDPHYTCRGDLDASAVVVDIGAYTGEMVASVRELYGCQVHAFEPSPASFAVLRDTFADDDHVALHPYGLGVSDEVLDLELDGPGSSLHGTLGSGGGSTVEVHVRDVLAVFRELGLERIDLLKVNIEGAEYDLLDRLIEGGMLERVRYVVVQFHEWHPGAHRRRRRIRRALRRSHDLVWDYPWIWEMWCSKAEPHPPRPPLTELEAAVIAAMRDGTAPSPSSESPASPGQLA
jgi:FkbM family methyltransferase